MSEEANESVLHESFDDDEDMKESNKEENDNSEPESDIESGEDVDDEQLDLKATNDKNSQEEGQLDVRDVDTEKINDAHSYIDSDEDEAQLNCEEPDSDIEEKHSESEDEHGNLEIADTINRTTRRHSLEEGEHDDDDDESEKDIRSSIEEGEHIDENICNKAESLTIRERKLKKSKVNKIDKEVDKKNEIDSDIYPNENKTNEADTQSDNCSVYDVSVQSNDLNCSFISSDTTKENEEGKTSKRKSDEGLEIRDELDFEEEKESGEEGEESDGDIESKKNVVINKEDGELSEEDEDDPSLRQEPKTVCRFFNKGQCTWGTNCRFLHPGVSDKGNYNMFAAPKPQSQAEKEDTTVDKERPREVRRYIPEPAGFESAWERGLRHAKEMMKRANKRKETDADFEEKRFNLSLGQAELDRENDYYTRPASPVYKPSDEVIEYLDPYEKQAIRHFRGGHFENFEVRYKVDQAYPRGPEHMRSRRDKFEREVTERIPRRIRATSPAVEEHKTVKEKRYPRPRTWKEERAQEVPAGGLGKGEAEVWADPWARRKTPVKRTKKVPRNRSYSSGSSSKSSRSSRSSSYSRSGSRSTSRSTSRSKSSRSSSRSITPPIHPRQQRATMNRGGGRGGRGRGIDRGGRGGGPPRNFYQTPQYSQPPNPPPNHPLAPDVNFLRQHAPGGGMGSRRGHGREDNRFPTSRPQETRNPHPGSNERFVTPRPPQEARTQPVPKERVPPMQFKQEPRFSQEPRERVANQRKNEQRNIQADQHERPQPPFQRNPDARQKPTESRERPQPPFQRNPDARQKPTESRERFANPRPQEARPIPPDSKERVDMFGRTIRKDVPKSPSKSPKRQPTRPHGRRRFSLSPSRSGSSSSGSRSRSESGSGSGSRSRSSSGSVTPPPSPVNKKKERVRRQPPPPGTVSYGETAKTKAIDLAKVAGQKQQIKLTLKKPGPVKPVDKAVLDVDDDSGESDTDARILKKRKAEAAAPAANPPPPKKPRVPSPTAIASLTTGTVGIKKPSAARREELLKQLRAVEDAIARKRSKPL